MPTIHLNNYQKGQTSSPYINNGAFSRAQNLDVFSQPGMARINYLPVDKDSGGIITDIPTSIFQRTQDQVFYVACKDEKVFTYTASTGAVAALGTAGQSVVYYKGYILADGVTNLRYWVSGTTWSKLKDSGGGRYYLFYIVWIYFLRKNLKKK